MSVSELFVAIMTLVSNVFLSMNLFCMKSQKSLTCYRKHIYKHEYKLNKYKSHLQIDAHKSDKGSVETSSPPSSHAPPCTCAFQTWRFPVSRWRDTCHILTLVWTHEQSWCDRGVQILEWIARDTPDIWSSVACWYSCRCTSLCFVVVVHSALARFLCLPLLQILPQNGYVPVTTNPTLISWWVCPYSKFQLSASL